MARHPRPVTDAEKAQSRPLVSKKYEATPGFACGCKRRPSAPKGTRSTGLPHYEMGHLLYKARQPNCDFLHNWSSCADSDSQGESTLTNH